MERNTDHDYGASGGGEHDGLFTFSIPDDSLSVLKEAFASIQEVVSSCVPEEEIARDVAPAGCHDDDFNYLGDIDLVSHALLLSGISKSLLIGDGDITATDALAVRQIEKREDLAQEAVKLNLSPDLVLGCDKAYRHWQRLASPSTRDDWEQPLALNHLLRLALQNLRDTAQQGAYREAMNVCLLEEKAHAEKSIN